MKSFSPKKTRSSPTENALKEIPTLKPFEYKPLSDRFAHTEKKLLGEKKKKQKQ